MKKPILIIILALGLFLRIYKLGTFPSGFLWDEAALGYNAYSILETGKDEYGNQFPLIFKSFGDYKPGFYVYAAIPSIAIFGLNEFSTRLPSAIAGVIAIYLLYVLVKKNTNNHNLALISAFVLAINPWHLNFSRGSWELNVMLTETLAMLICFQLYIERNKKVWLFGAIVFLIASLFTYQAAKIMSPLLLIIYWYFNQGKNWHKKYINLFFLGGVIITLLLFIGLTFSGGNSNRLKAMSLFSYPRSPDEASSILGQDNGKQTIFTIFHSPLVFFTRSVSGRYLNHFTGKFLFIDGDWPNPRQGVVYHGLFYFIDIIFIVLGLWLLVKNKITPFSRCMLLWLFIAPIPSALSRDSVSSVRSFTMIIPLVYLIANGIYWFVLSIKYYVSGITCFRSTNTKYQITITSLMVCCLFIIVLYLFSLIRFADLYLNHNSRIIAQDRLYGYRQAVEAIIEKGKTKDKIIFTPKYGQPYIFYLFYSQYDPKLYQQQAKLKENPYGDVGQVERIDNIEFRQVYWPSDRNVGNSLLIGTDEELPLVDIIGEPDKFLVDQEIKYPNGKVAFRVVETK